jgi:hypothetical protein
MIHTIKIINPLMDPSQWSLVLTTSSDVDGVVVFNLEGLGTPKATVSGLSGPTYDGVRGHFVRTDARHILLTLAVTARGDAEEATKQKIYDYFPVKGEISFGVATDTKDVYIPAVVESVEMNQFAKVENMVISLYCPQPYFLDQIEEWKYAEYREISKIIYYEGTIPIGALLLVYCGEPYGPVSFTIENDRENQSMSWDDLYFNIGDKYHISTVIGEKSVNRWDAELDSWHNITHLVSPTSQWIKLYPGENVITVTISGTFQGPMSNRPDEANLEIYLPLNEWNDESPLDLHTDKTVKQESGSILGGSGKYYPRARDFTWAETAYIETLPLYEELCPTGDFTISFWLNAHDNSNVQTVISSWDDPDDGFKIDLDGAGNIQFTIRRGGSNQSVSRSYGSLNVWRHVFCWYDSVADVMYVSLNNDAPSTRSSTLAPNVYQSSLMVGARHGQVAHLDGMVESVMFYSVVLTSTERTYIYNGHRAFGYSAMVEKNEISVKYRKQYQGV